MVEQDRILTWDSWFKDVAVVRHRHLIREAGRRGVALSSEPQVDDMTLPVIVNAGRWLVLCPWCAGAEYAREDRLHICQSCWNAKAGRKYVRTTFPENRLDIEAALLPRLDPATRNWMPNETLADLLAENATAGIAPEKET